MLQLILYFLVVVFVTAVIADDFLNHRVLVLVDTRQLEKSSGKDGENLESLFL